MTKEEKVILETELERKGEFSSHINPPAFEKIISVDGSYNYIRKGILKKIESFFGVLIFKFAGLIISPFCGLKVVGKENLKKAKKAVLTSNHINDIDCVLIKHVLSKKPLKIVVADINNPKGVLGNLLRAGGTLPLSNSIKGMQNLSNAISYYLEKNNFVLVYPEGSEWWCYEKPRPLIRGAFYYAVNNNVPIIPMFFTFINRKNGRKKFVLNIGEPIYSEENLQKKERIENLSNKVFEYNKGVYEKFYNKKLEYLK